MCADRTGPQGGGRPVALVTDAGRRAGIATASALRLAETGWEVAFTHFPTYEARMAWGADNGAADELVDRLRACGARTCAIEADFQEAEVPARVFDQAHAALGPVTGLVLGHCESVASSILDTSLESFDRHFAVNTRAAWLLIRQHVTSILGTVENF